MTEYEFRYEGNLSRVYPSCRSDIRGDKIYEIVVKEETIRVKGDLIFQTLSDMKLTDSSGIVRGPIGVIRGPIELDELGDLDID